MAAISPARRAAFHALLAIARAKCHSDDLLRAKECSSLAAADRNLATTLILGVLRWQIWLDAQIRPRLKRPNAKLDLEVLLALRLGAFQLYFLDRVPAHAAIDESVELAKQSGHRFAAGLVNAVLRGAAREAAAHGRLLRDGAAAVEAHPAWLVERWTTMYGAEVTQAICRRDQCLPRTALRLADPAAREELGKAGIEIVPGELLTAAYTVVSGDVTATAAFREGRVRVQDEGSQLVGELASCAALAQNAESILDACAAPGGKTLILVERDPQRRVVACEASPKRFAALRKRLAGHESRVECRLADVTAFEEDSTFDFALADAPCSGTGTLGRNPEIRHRLQSEELPRLAERQGMILRSVLRLVRPGGRVVYSTCSLEPEENELLIAAVLQENRNLRRVSLAPVIDTLKRDGILAPEGADRIGKSLTPEGALLLLPGAVPSDGFFVALIERSA